MNRDSIAITSSSVLDAVMVSLQNDEPEKAQEQLLRLVLEDRTNPDVWIWLYGITLNNTLRVSFLRQAFFCAPNQAEIQRKLVEFVVKELAPQIQTEGREEAIRLLLEILEFFPQCEPAWFCLAFSAESDAECRHCLESLLYWNPKNQQAIAWLSSLGFSENSVSPIPSPFDTAPDSVAGIPDQEGKIPKPTSSEDNLMPNVKESLIQVMEIEGTVGAAIADWKSGMCLGTIGGTPTYNLEIAAAGNTEVVRAKMKAMANLGIKESIEDILITLDHQFHLIRIIRSFPNLFFYVAIKKDTGNLALARHKLSLIENGLTV